MNKIRTIIIDDERSSREELKRALKKYVDIEVIGEAQHATEAKEQIEAKHPDLIFLDIHMPEQSGFELLESLDVVPAVIFTTAFDQYAVQAFEINALDYLMKPIREERFDKAIERIRTKQADPPQQLFIKDGEKCFFVKLQSISLIESLGNYSRLYFEGKKAMLKRSLSKWEELLDAAIFFRINRTQLINIHHIREVQSSETGRFKINLTTGEWLEVSDRQSVKFRNLNSNKPK
ncbi:DNA-binding response regulator [Niastella vici]|uniref:DNA-binding response regulator n=1 Tax=Niastella vici TaxID=1703345 RepID=A0A1V9FS33_9BACT|nr:response regulator [Niastella vici]OQP61164.1 DNA-binding response regulator [Niastella vici]